MTDFLNTMTVKMAMMSHLSDIEALNGIQGKEAELHEKAEFVKFLILNHPDNTKEINAREEWEKYVADRKRRTGK